MMAVKISDSKDEFDEDPILDSSELVAMHRSSLAVESELQEENVNSSEPLMFVDVDPGAKIVSPIVCVEASRSSDWEGRPYDENLSHVAQPVEFVVNNEAKVADEMQLGIEWDFEKESTSNGSIVAPIPGLCGNCIVEDEPFINPKAGEVGKVSNDLDETKMKKDSHWKF